MNSETSTISKLNTKLKEPYFLRNIESEQIIALYTPQDVTEFANRISCNVKDVQNVQFERRKQINGWVRNLSIKDVEELRAIEGDDYWEGL